MRRIRTFATVLALAAGASVAEAGRDKYLMVAHDAAYDEMVRAEGFTYVSHATRIYDPLRRYLSDASRFWLTFNRGFTFASWSSPQDAGSEPSTFMRDLRADFPGASWRSWALCAGLTGKRAGTFGVFFGTSDQGGPDDRLERHSVVFYRSCRDWADTYGVSRFTLARKAAAEEIGHTFGGYRHDDSGAAPSSGPCAMSHAIVSRYCPNHESAFHRYQRNVGNRW